MIRAENGMAIRAPRSAVLCRLAGLVAGVLVASLLATAPPDWLGLGVMLAAPAFSLCLLAGVLAGELATARPLGSTRTATLEVRTVRRYLPRVMTWWVGTLLVLLVALLTATTLAGSADDQGRIGRTLSRSCDGYSGHVSPWPGSYYSAPMAVVVILGLGAAALVARAVVRRHRPGSAPHLVAADDQARRLSARIVTAACGILVAAPLTGVALVAGDQLLRFDCATQPMRLAGRVALAVAVAAGVSSCAFVAEILLPRRRS